MTINESWGYNPRDTHYKSARRLIHTLCEVAGKGGNLLLNVGPMGDGRLPAELTDRLDVVRAWMGRNSESILGTSPALAPWQFYGPTDTRGFEVEGMTKISRIKKPVDTIYFADNEYGSWRPIISDTGTTISEDLNDVWQPEHLPYAADGHVINSERRVALARHGNGCNLLYFDGHSAWKKAKLIVMDDWREEKRW